MGSMPTAKWAPADHAPQVITTAAANVENGAAGQRRNVRQHAIPLPVGMPFIGIDIDAIQRERPLPPRHQGAQHFRMPSGWPGDRPGSILACAGSRSRRVGVSVGKCSTGLEPLFEFAVQRFALPGAELRGRYPTNG